MPLTPNTEYKLDDDTSFKFLVDEKSADFKKNVIEKLEQAQSDFLTHIESRAVFPFSSTGVFHWHSPGRAEAVVLLATEITQLDKPEEIKAKLVDFFENKVGNTSNHSLKTLVMNQFVAVTYQGEFCDSSDPKLSSVRQSLQTEIVKALKGPSEPSMKHKQKVS